MSDHNFFLHDAVHILRSNGTDDHADAVQWAAAEIERLQAALKAAEAQRDALLKAAEPIIAESSREDRDDYRVRVKTADIRALAAAVAGARPEINEGEDNA